MTARPVLSPSALTKLGVFVRSGFISSASAASLCREMGASTLRKAIVGRSDSDYGVLDGEERESDVATVSDPTVRALAEQIRALRPEIEAFFGVQVAHRLEYPKFLVYSPGGFFRPHRDRRPPHDRGNHVYRMRCINVILSLNSRASEPTPGHYVGDGLIVYELMTGAPKLGFPMPSESGTLIAFRSQVLHEVVPITAGQRFCMITRFMDPDFDAAEEAAVSATERI